ncbi:glycogen/starch/alpha-glucan phosphorylase [Labrys monachus]|uniref:Alpha-1,4 glucan phosphorylase n=1 Tax=Labrys monachus TaxID=217067 RepID=A0ABU0FKL4_9HYPH|nr:glycogen/starch/alpha-glucan phosphorylase [Labrys monachus]MDQ0394590.1 starch phosphorylase [Labrys monachus]
MDATLQNKLYSADTALAVADEAAKLPEATGDARAFRDLILAKLTYAVGKDPIVARDHDWLRAVSLALRDHIVDRWMATTRGVYRMGGKRVYYLSLEFLIGRLLKDGLNNMNLLNTAREALASVGVDLDMIAEMEPDAALGNGGLGRLAACFMESMATVGVAAYGYGIRYENGLFRQNIVDGWQTESPENWLANGNPWEFPRREVAYEIGFGGAVEATEGWDGSAVHAWKPGETILGVAHDTPAVGWRGNRVNTLRLWSARSLDPISLDAFNAGDHVGALAERNRAESISRVLYPADSTPAGQELRLRQEYFFTSASLQDIVRRHMQQYRDIRTFANKAAIQLNDTHPAIAVAELMRILIDIHALSWSDAFTITRDTISYTNHTLLPEALETWPVPLIERLLPRHMQIIYAINARVLSEARSSGASDAMIAAVSIIDESHGRRVRMGNLAFVGSHKVNGVSALHSNLMKETVFKDLNTLFPGRITNKTNGITPRRWLMTANPGLTTLLRETIGDGYLDNAEKLVALERFAKDAAFQDSFATIKHANKARLAKLIQQSVGLRVDPSALFDVQIKRIHEYKRQLLNILETVALYNAIRAHPEKDWVPRVKIFAGKAAASYTAAKYVIKLINDVARVVNADPAVRNLLKVVFLPNYNVSLAETVIPAANLSEQISTAGMEASGTGNMKFGLNGALTIGTLDGANVEMLEHVGADNIFIFGLKAGEVEQRRQSARNPGDTIAASHALAEVLDAVESGVFSPTDPERHKGTVQTLRTSDWFLVTDDFDAYTAMQRKIDALWVDGPAWNEKAILNVARMGWFSSDRTIREYSDEIWGVPTLPV